MIDTFQFVPEQEIDQLYLGNVYYITPDGELGIQDFAVIREAIKQEGTVALGRVVFTSREHVIGLKPRDKGLMGVTLRYAYEVRQAEDHQGDARSSHPHCRYQDGHFIPRSSKTITKRRLRPS